MSNEDVAEEELGEESNSIKPSPTPSKSSSLDVLNTEFIYYGAVLRNYLPALSRESDKTTAGLWMKKLYGPLYCSTVLKPKRNKYVLYLTITIFNNETYGIFKREPPCGVLPELKDIPFKKEFPPAAWEVEKQWAETISDLPEENKYYQCYLHEGECPAAICSLNAVLDSQFQFYLWLSRPYVALLTDAEEKTIAARWIQLLCGIAPDVDNCTEMKELRNEYMESLLGYVHDLRIEGPFRRMPPFGPVPRLALWYEHCRGDPEFEDSSEREADQFLSRQPLPDSGAFAYINVTGELFGNSI
ncbi:hypothetical protein RUM44_005024 [Polyplax serrata]|uniref:DUF4485 domain-containing protein n=1 Tax=Polyplax serrata TaxID=468196 RepID=A0ABR1AWR5_POLSC